MRSINVLFFSFLLLLPLVSANINVDHTPSILYNFGDKLLVSGQVEENASFRGQVAITLQCSQPTPISTKLIDLEENKASSFSQLFIAPEGQTGTCFVNVGLLNEQGALLEQQKSNEFVITSDLLANFESLKPSYQLGEHLDVKGVVSKYNGVGIDGLAVLKFKKEDQIISRDSAPIKLGTLSLTKDLSLLPPGIYTLDIEAKDNEGNQKTFSNIYNFTLEGNLDVVAHPEKNIYKPGETFTLTGNVKSKIGSVLKSLSVSFQIDDTLIKTQTLETSDEFYKFSYLIPTTIKSGDHSYTINAKDQQGNIGVIQENFTIQGIPTTLILQVNQSSFVPEEKIPFLTVLLDQAKDPMVATVNLALLNSQGESKYQQLVQTNIADTLEVPSQSLPGTWKLKLDGFGLHDERIITVRELKSLDVQLDGTELVVKNKGNVPFKDFLQVNTQDKPSGKDLKLGLGEEARVKLSKLFEAGNYTVTIPFTGDKFDNVQIPPSPGLLDDLSSVTGNAIGNLHSPGNSLLLLLGFLVIVVALIFILKPHKEKRVIHEEITIRPKVKKQSIQTEYNSTEYTKEQKPKYGIADEKDIEDFRKRMTKMIQDDERNKQRTYYGGSYSSPSSNYSPSNSNDSTKTNDSTKNTSSSNPSDPPAGAFDMFK